MSDLNPLIRQTLYALKRRYPGRIDIYVMGDVSTNPKTGTRTTIKTVYPVERAIVLPAKLGRAEKRGISFISANKALVQGGFYDATARKFIVDRADVPGIVELTEDDWLVFKGRKYQFESVQEFEDDTGWIIAGRAVLGEVPEQVFLMNADTLISLASEAGGE